MWSPRRRAPDPLLIRQRHNQRATDRNLQAERDDFANRSWGEAGNETFRNQEDRWARDQNSRRRDPFVPPRTPRILPQRPAWERAEEGYDGEVGVGGRSPSPPPYRSVDTLPRYPRDERRDEGEYSGRHQAGREPVHDSRQRADREPPARGRRARDEYWVNWLQGEEAAGSVREPRRRRRFPFGRPEGRARGLGFESPYR